MNRRALLLAGVGSAVAAAPAAFVATLLTSRAEDLPAGAHVGGVDVGGVSPQEALQRVEAAWRPFLDGPVVFRLGGQVWRPSGADIGLRADFHTPLREIVASRATGGVLDRMAGLPAAANTAAPVVSYDREVARSYLTSLAAGFDQPSVSAALELRNDGRVSLTPGQAGRVVDVERALAGQEARRAQRAVGQLVEKGISPAAAPP
ncbi:MAG: hypothetical protein F4Y03_09555, partial [Alphaproteobacteria bacterium]|nr:hypothetical protein [Alphaproteobacteria bacterium]